MMEIPTIIQLASDARMKPTSVYRLQKTKSMVVEYQILNGGS